MRCPKCGSRMMCRSTRELGERVLRYRTCERCGASAPTIERLLRVSRIAHAGGKGGVTESVNQADVASDGVQGWKNNRVLER